MVKKSVIHKLHGKIVYTQSQQNSSKKICQGISLLLSPATGVLIHGWKFRQAVQFGESLMILGNNFEIVLLWNTLNLKTSNKNFWKLLQIAGCLRSVWWIYSEENLNQNKKNIYFWPEYAKQI